MTLLFTMFLLWKYLPCSNEIFPLVSPHPLLPPLPAAHHCDATKAVSTHAWDRKADIFSKLFTFALLCLPNDAKCSAVLASIAAEFSGISEPVLGWCSAAFLPSCPWTCEGPIGSGLCQCKLKPAALRDPRGLVQRLHSRCCSEEQREGCSSQLALG